MNPRPHVLDAFERKARWYVACQFLILGGLVAVSLLNEWADLPHWLLGSTPTSPEMRWGEILIEAIAFAVALTLEILFIVRLRHQVRVLHGIVPICTRCERVYHEAQWQPMEDYIATHSEAFFHHTLCPDCRPAEDADYGRREVRTESLL
jgi:hypothetical protein